LVWIASPEILIFLPFAIIDRRRRCRAGRAGRPDGAAMVAVADRAADQSSAATTMSGLVAQPGAAGSNASRHEPE
jgi:hypothetical protein